MLEKESFENIKNEEQNIMQANYRNEEENQENENLSKKKRNGENGKPTAWKQQKKFENIEKDLNFLSNDMQVDHITAKNKNFQTSGLRKFAGLYNMGNTCYLNAVLRCFLMSPIFLYQILDFAFKFGYEDRTITENEDEKDQIINAQIKHKYKNKLYKVEECEVLNEYIEIAYKSLLKEASHINPKPLKLILDKYIPFFGKQPNMQQDAHEFLCYFLDVLNSETSKFLAKKFAKEENSLPKTPIEKIINIKIKQNLTCQSLRCSYTRSLMDEERCISLDVPLDFVMKDENKDFKLSLTDLLKFYFGKTEVEYKCDKCESRIAKKYFLIQKKPQILLLHLKRFMPDLQTFRLKKIRHCVEINETISLDEFCETSSADEDAEKTKTDTTGKENDNKEEDKSNKILEEKKNDDTKFFDMNINDDKINNQNTCNFNKRNNNNANTNVPMHLYNDNNTKIKMKSKTDINNNSSAEFSSTFSSSSSSFSFASDKYRLKAFVAHLGVFSEVGHYVSYVKNFKQNVWTKWDDTNQERLSDILPPEGHVDGYIFFYEKEKQKN